MSEFDIMAFEEPRPVEQEPEAVDYFISLIKEKVPMSIANLPADLVEMQFVRQIEKGKSVSIKVFNDGRDGGEFAGDSTIYELYLTQDHYRGDLDDFPMYSDILGVAVEEDSLDAVVIQSSSMFLDEYGRVKFDERDSDNGEGEEVESLNTAQLATLIMALEELPDNWAMQSD